MAEYRYLNEFSVGTRFLLRERFSHYPKEATLIEKSPSNLWVKLRWQSGNETWNAVYDWIVVEELEPTKDSDNS